MSLFFAFAAVHNLAVASPGPDFVLVMRNSLLFGRHAGIWTTSGISLAVSIHVTGCFLGIGMLAVQFPGVLRFFQLIGAAYLAAIGARMLLHSKHAKGLQVDPGNEVKQLAAYKAFRMGLLCNLLNPKASLFFWTFWAQFMRLQPSFSLQVALAIYAVASAAIWFMALSVLLSSHAIAQRLVPWQNRISRLGGLILLSFALSVGLAAS
ncbi:MAG: LysE family translocator [Myxococcota bacterium]